MTYCPWITLTLKIIWVRCIPLNLRYKTRRRATLLLPTWIYSCQSVGTVNFTLPFTTSVTFLISILQTFRSWAATSHSRPPIAFLSHNSSDTPGLVPLINVLFWGPCDFPISFSGGICKGTFEIVSKEVLWAVRGSYQTILGPLSRMLHDILDDKHLQWHHPLIRYYFWPSYRSGSYNRIWLFTLLWEVSIEHLQRVRHANRGRLLLRTPGPVPLWDLQVF